VLDVDAVGGVDEKDVARGGDRAAAHIVLRDAHLLRHHVEDPDDVGFFLKVVRFATCFEQLFFLLVGAVVFAIVKSLGVETTNFTPAGDEPESIALRLSRAADTL
jgi:hypothetical protein